MGNYCLDGFVGIGEVVGIVKDALCGNSPWVDKTFPLALGRLSMAVSLDRLTSTAEAIADRYAPGADSLKGKVIIITGSTGGLGMEAAKTLLKHGAHVIFAVRNLSKGEAVRKSIIEDGGATGKGTVLKLDMTDLRSVESFAKSFLALKLPCHVLMLNAGIMMPKELEKTVQGYESQFGVNHLAGFYLTKLLEKKILESGTVEDPARVVYVSSEAAEMWAGPGSGKGLAEQVPPTRAYHPFHNYCLSKSCNIATAKEQQKRWGAEATAIAVSIHPGIIKTNLLANAGKIEGAFYGWPFLYAQKSVEQGASTQVYAAIAKQVVKEVRSGAYYYYNNDVQTPWYATKRFSDEVCAEIWKLTEKLLPKFLS